MWVERFNEIEEGRIELNFGEQDFWRTHLYSRWAYKRGGGGLYPGGLISGIKYSLVNGWAYIRGIFKSGGGGLKSEI